MGLALSNGVRSFVSVCCMMSLDTINVFQDSMLDNCRGFATDERCIKVAFS